VRGTELRRVERLLGADTLSCPSAGDLQHVEATVVMSEPLSEINATRVRVVGFAAGAAVKDADRVS
jgi:hypothetical protein